MLHDVLSPPSRAGEMHLVLRQLSNGFVTGLVAFRRSSSRSCPEAGTEPAFLSSVTAASLPDNFPGMPFALSVMRKMDG